jgi:hypothetical protein
LSQTDTVGVSTMISVLFVTIPLTVVPSLSLIVSTPLVKD